MRWGEADKVIIRLDFCRHPKSVALSASGMTNPPAAYIRGFLLAKIANPPLLAPLGWGDRMCALPILPEALFFNNGLQLA